MLLIKIQNNDYYSSTLNNCTQQMKNNNKEEGISISKLIDFRIKLEKYRVYSTFKYDYNIYIYIYILNSYSV